jgi:DNA-binding MarR family transcriptional regulator
MSPLTLNEIPRYECLMEVAKRFHELDPKSLEVFLHLIRVSEELSRYSQCHFAQHGITKGRFIVLMLLSDKVMGRRIQSPTPAELADKANCTRATMTGLVDSLERDGLVQRIPDSLDRRMMRVSLTDKGNDFMIGFLPEHFRRITNLMSCLDNNEQVLLVGLLGKLVERCGAAAPLCPSLKSECE